MFFNKLLESVRSLEANLAHLGSRLLLATGSATERIPPLVERWKIDRVVAQRTIEPDGRARDQRLRERLRVPFTLLEGETLQPPGTQRTQSGTPFLVYTAFARAFMHAAAIDEPLATPRRLPALPPDVVADATQLPTLEQLGIDANRRVIAAIATQHVKSAKNA